MSWRAAIAAPAAALLWLALEPHTGFGPLLLGQAPDLLFALALCLARDHRAGLGPAILLGALREAVSGGARGSFIAGYALACSLASRGRTRRAPRRVAFVFSLCGLTALAHLPAATAVLWAGADGAPLFGAVCATALATACAAPACTWLLDARPEPRGSGSPAAFVGEPR